MKNKRGTSTTRATSKPVKSSRPAMPKSSIVTRGVTARSARSARAARAIGILKNKNDSIVVVSGTRRVDRAERTTQKLRGYVEMYKSS